MLNDTWQIVYNKIYSKVFQFLFIEITSPIDYPEQFVTRFERVSHNLKNCIYYKKYLAKYLPYYHLISILPRILRHKLIQDINRGFFIFCLARDVANNKEYISRHSVSNKFGDNLHTLVGWHEIKVLNLNIRNYD